MRVDPQSSVYTGDTVTLSCELLQGTGWEILCMKNSQYLEHNLNTISITVSDPGEEEYQCAARWRGYYTEYSDPIRIKVRGKSCSLLSLLQMTRL